MSNVNWNNIFNNIQKDKNDIKYELIPINKHNVITHNVLNFVKYNIKNNIITLPIYQINNYLYFHYDLINYININNINNYLYYFPNYISFTDKYLDILHYFENGFLNCYIPVNEHFYNFINITDINNKLNYITSNFLQNRTEIYNLYNSIYPHIIYKENLEDKIIKLEDKIIKLEKKIEINY